MADRLAVLCLAFLLHGQPELPPLEPLYRQALKDREAALGTAHPKVGESLVDLASFLMRNGKAAAAGPLLLRARTIFEKKDAVALAAVLEREAQ
jgi:hypothetical protein